MERGVPIQKRKGIGLAIVSGRGLCPVDMVCSLAMQSWPTNTNFHIAPIFGMDTDAGRTQAVKAFRELGAKYLWFVDDDTVPPVDAGRHLAYLLDQNGPPFGKVMVAGGIYTTRNSPPEPLVFQEQGAGPSYDWKVGETFKCWGLGTGCMMINLAIFDHLEEPWFKTVLEAENRWTDDLYFCDVVRKAGFEIMAHGGILCHHYDAESGIVYQLPRNCRPYRDRVSEPREPNFVFASQGGTKPFDLVHNPWMTPHETAWLIEQARNAKTFVEVGCWRGVTTRNIATNAPDCTVYAVDTFTGSKEHVTPGSEHYEPRLKQNPNWLREEAVNNAGHLDNVTLVPMASHAAAALIPSYGTLPDVAFIDASHEYEDVKADIAAWLPAVKPGGLLCGHDYNWPDVAKAVNELLPQAVSVPASSIWMYRKP